MATRCRRKPNAAAAVDLVLANLSPSVKGVGKGSDPGGDGYANRTERAYAAHLEMLKQKGEIKDWQYEPVRLRLSDLKRGRRSSAKGRKEAWYTPDFLVRLNDDTLVIHEVKGREMAAEMVRFRVAASMHWYRFVLVKKTGANWEEEVFSSEAD